MTLLEELQLYDLPKPVELAIFFGIIKPGWTLEDYLIYASTHERGYETVSLWALQGSGKSSRMLQMLYWIYFNILQDDEEAWKAVLDHIVFKPSTFVERLEAIPDNVVLPALGWDDIGVHYPATKFRTDIQQYEAVDSTWAAIRTKVHVIFTTIPLIDRLAKNVRDNTTFEVFMGPNQMELINRVFHLPGTRFIESNFFKVVLEKPAKFELFMAPEWVWKEYWKRRLKLTREALQVLRQATDMEDIEGYIPVLEAAKIAQTQGIKYATSTIQQDISRGILRGQRIVGRLCVDENDFYENLILKGGQRLTHTTPQDNK